MSNTQVANVKVVKAEETPVPAVIDGVVALSAEEFANACAAPTKEGGVYLARLRNRGIKIVRDFREAWDEYRQYMGPKSQVGNAGQRAKNLQVLTRRMAELPVLGTIRDEIARLHAGTTGKDGLTIQTVVMELCKVGLSATLDRNLTVKEAEKINKNATGF